MRYAKGFTILEVVVAMNLLMFSFFCGMTIQTTILNLTNGALRRTIALERLHTLAALFCLEASNFNALYQRWQKENRVIFSHVTSEIQQKPHEVILRLYWPGTQYFWSCTSARRPLCACSELKVMRT